MGRFIDSRTELVENLEAAGLRVCLRLEDVAPPCVWPLFFDFDHGHLDGGGELRWRLHLIESPTDDERLLERLETMLDTLLAADIYPSENTTLVGVQVPENDQPLPALQVTITDTI
jgi:hypothetical protein